MDQKEKSIESNIKVPTLTPDTHNLNLTLSRVSNAVLRTGNEVSILLNGEETYRDWFDAIENAKKWIHLENYIINSDEIGKKFGDLLCRKAKEGVKVRVLYDWFGCLATSKSFWNKLKACGIEVRSVSPLKIFAPFNLIHRDHRKFLGVDGIYASTGGVCIGDQWLEISPNTGLPYRDTAVNIKGPAIIDLENAFSHVWNKLGEHLPIEEIPNDLNFPELAGKKAVRVIEQVPGKMRIMKLIELMISGAQRRIWIADAYFLAVPSLYQALINAAKDGVDVRILLPATNDIKWIGVVSRAGYRQLLEAGVKIWEYSGLMMHSKTTVVDGWWSRIGSTNMNISSLLLNWELDLVIEDREFGQRMEEIFENDLKDAREISLNPKSRFKVEPKRPRKAEELVAQKKLSRTRGAGSGSRFISAAARVGSIAVKSSGSALYKHERKVSGCVSVLAFVCAVVFILFPRFIAWPLGVVLLIIGIIALVRVLQPIKD